MQVVGEGFKYTAPIIKGVVLNFLNIVYKETLFFTRPVKEVVFGYDDPALAMLMTVLPAFFDRSKIGYFIRVRTLS